MLDENKAGTPNETGLPSLPSFDTPQPSAGESFTRTLAILMAGLSGNPEQSALLFRSFQAQDSARVDAAKAEFDAQLALAQESRIRSQFTTSTEIQRGQLEATQKGLTLEEQRNAQQAARDKYQQGRDLIEDEQKRRDYELRQKALNLQASQNRDEAQRQYLNAINSMGEAIGGILARAQGRLTTSDLGLENIGGTIGSETDPEKQKQLLMQQILSKGGTKLTQAYPTEKPEDVAKEIAAQVQLYRPAVPDEYKPQFDAAVLAVQDSSIQKLKRGQRDMTPEEVAKGWNEVIIPQIRAAFMDDRAFTPEESNALITLLSQQNVDKTLTLELLQTSMNRAVVETAAALGLDAADQEHLSSKMGLALWDSMEKGAAISSTFEMLGDSDPLVRQIQLEMQSIENQAAELMKKGQAVQAGRLRAQKPKLEAQLEAAKRSRPTRIKAEQHVGRGARR